MANIPNADDGFNLIFSATPFPGYQFKLDWIKKEMGGDWYRSNMNGWLYPALLKYFDAPPTTIYAQIKPL